MISQHAKLARTLAEQLDLPDKVREAIGAAYEQWDGQGWPGDLRGEAIPIAARIAQLAEFMEVAHRVGGVAAATALARRRAGRQFDPALAALLCARREEILGGLDAVPAWRTVIAAEPALAVELSEEQLDSALAAIANFVDLKSPFTLGHSVAVADWRRRPGAGSDCRWSRFWRCAGPGWSTVSGGSAYRIRSGTGPGRWARANGNASGCIPT